MIKIFILLNLLAAVANGIFAIATDDYQHLNVANFNVLSAIFLVVSK